MPLSDLAAAVLATALEPTIDVHRHAAWPESDGEQVRLEQLNQMRREGVGFAVVSITNKRDIARWQGSPVIVGVAFPCPRNLTQPRYKCFPEDEGWPDLEWLEGEIKAGRVGAMHELGPNYYGISAANPRFDAYWRLASTYDIPVGVHTQRGPGPGGKHSTRSEPGCCPDYDPQMGNPALLRPVLEKYSNLRIWIQHVGAGRGDHGPFWDETLALLKDYPSVYVDLSITNSAMPAQQHEAALRRLIDAGFGDRIMLGSDNLPVPPILERLRGFAWLSHEQRRAILYDNAARFFRLTDASVRGSGF